MKDMEFFTRLCHKARPDLLIEWLKDYPLPAAPTDDQDNLNAWREAVHDTVEHLDLVQHSKIEGMAERIVLIADRAGQEAIATLKDCIAKIAELQQQPDALNRTLWLFLNEPECFLDAESARFAIEYHASSRIYSGFEGPAGQSIHMDADRLETLKQKIRDTLGIQGDILIDHFMRSRFSDDADEVSLHHLTVAFNAEQNSYDMVVQNRLETRYYIPAKKLHLTYEPASGTIEVYASSIHSARRDLARAFADSVLQAQISGDSIPLREYDLDSLTAPRELPVGDEPALGAKLQMIKFRQDTYRTDERGRQRPVDNTLAIQVDRNDPRTVFDIATEEFGLSDFALLAIKQIKIVVQLPKSPGKRARSIPITITAPNHCSNSGLTEADRQLRDRLLEMWGILVKF